MRPLPRITQASRTRRLPGRWLAAMLIIAAALLLAPGVSHATASQTRPAAAGCIGVTPATFPATGFISDPARTQGGHLWWRHRAGSANVCIGTVVEWVWYTTTATKTWKVIIYSARHPHGQMVASRTFTLSRGWYSLRFKIRHAYTGLSAVCITADESFGTPCIHFGRDGQRLRSGG